MATLQERLAELIAEIGADVKRLVAGGSSALTFPAAESLFARAYVRVISGKVYLASRDDPTKPADGFVKAAVATGDDAEVFPLGINAGFAGLTPDVLYVLGVNGAVLPATEAPATAGTLLQAIGTAISGTEINTRISDPILRGGA